jgi:HD superfamily phosphohydrolase
MKRREQFPTTYQGIALIADPIYNYISFTVPKNGELFEITEKDIIDNPWMQRLRRIHQLQSARWVYPSAEHSRFQHSLGVMHMSGDFALHMYPSLKQVCPDIPSRHCFEELFRISGLLHDVGHGPYGHFFDTNFLSKYHLSHEMLGQEIVIKKLGEMIRGIKRSPNGPFEPGEKLDPRQIAFLIRKPEDTEYRHPTWLKFSRQLFSGIYTVDNLDYVQRDAYMTGFSIDIVDIKRLLYYSFFTDSGLTLHRAGISAFTRFLNARLNLYSNIYYHRTTRAIDLHMQEIFEDTMKLLFPYNPAVELDKYLGLNEWYLFQEVEKWARSKDRNKRALGKEWGKIISREVKWRMAYSTELTIDIALKGIGFSHASDYERAIRERLPGKYKRVKFLVDLATQDPRPLNPVAESEKRINIYNPSNGITSPEPLREIFKFIPAKMIHFRVFALNHDHDTVLSAAAEQVLNASDKEEFHTNI